MHRLIVVCVCLKVVLYIIVCGSHCSCSCSLIEGNSVVMIMITIMTSICARMMRTSMRTTRICQPFSRSCSGFVHAKHSIAFLVENRRHLGYHKLSKLGTHPSPCHLTSHHHLDIMSNVIGHVFLQFISNHNEGQASRHNQCSLIDSDF